MMKRQLWDRRIYPLLIGINVLLTALFITPLFGGRPKQTFCSRFGENMAKGGWTARVSWPRWWVEHCLWAYEPEE